MNLTSWKPEALVQGLRIRVQTERKITSEIVEFIQEIDRRRVYLEYGVTSLFALLTEVIGYSGSAAQRRIQAARLSNELPEIHESLKSGEINLSHLSIFAQGIKQKEKEGASKVSRIKKQEILEKLKSLSTQKSEVILAQELDLRIKAHDVVHKQKDDSIRAEMTLSKDDLEEIERAKSLLSHQVQNPKLSELLMFLVRDLLKRKDPLAKKVSEKKSTEKKEVAAESAVEPRQKAIERALHERDKSCRWKDKKTGKICGSTFQLQKDHIIPVWAGGPDELENYQLLCGVHNRMKYRLEANTTFVSDRWIDYGLKGVG